MEPRKDEEKKAPEARKEEKRPKRFRLVKLEERIAPSGGGGNSGVKGCNPWLNFTEHNCFGHISF